MIKSIRSVAWCAVLLANSALTHAAIIQASQAGAALDSDLLKGGGTDDTAVLQAILNRASNGKPLELVVDGVALISGLDVYPNTTIECLAGAGFFLKAGSSRAILRNAHRSRNEAVDAHITIRGCFMDGNRDHNPGAHPERFPYPEANQLADHEFVAGAEFLGVNDLTLEHVTLWNTRAFGLLLGNASRVTIRDITIDHGGGPDIDWNYLNTDGLHFKGPLRYVTVDGARLRTGDDAIALNADDGESNDLAQSNEFGPYVRSGPITDVTITNVQLMGSLFGIRLLSRVQRVDRIRISNVTGTINGPRLLVANNWKGPGVGNFGAIELDNVNVDRSADDKLNARFLQIVPKLDAFTADQDAYGNAVFFNLTTHMESFSLRNFRTNVDGKRIIFRLGAQANIEELNVDMSLRDPGLQAVPLQVDRGAHLGRLNFDLDWKGRASDSSQCAIVNAGGTMDEIRSSRPPRICTQ